MEMSMADFHGIISLDKALAAQLGSYLESKEAKLSHFIAHVPLQNPKSPLSTKKSSVTLTEGLETFTLNLKEIAQAPGRKSAKEMAAKINEVIWEYVELLEGMSVELFQQLSQVGIEFWRLELLEALEQIKDLLFHKMEDLKWVLKQIEERLKSYRTSPPREASGWQKFTFSLGLWRPSIDLSLSEHLEKSQKFLDINFQSFVSRYKKYQDLNNKIDQNIVILSSFPILNALEASDQRNYKNLYRLLKLWESNTEAKILPEQEIMRVIQHTSSPERASALFKDYFNGFKHKLFSTSRAIKKPASYVVKELDPGFLRQSLLLERKELHVFQAIIGKYRKYLLDNDPDPYVRTHGGFSEWIIGHEPSEMRAFVDQTYDAEFLDQMYYKFIKANENEGQALVVADVEDEIFTVLHEMSQPLASYAMLRVRGEHIMGLLQSLDELTSRDPKVIPFFTKVLSKAMRADWRYHVLFEKDLFHKIYGVHITLLGPIQDRAHSNRLQQFQKLLMQISAWVKQRKTFKHFQAIESDIHDIKGSLQDFFAHLQRFDKDPHLNEAKIFALMENGYHQLLIYRYLFGNFFYQLRLQEADQKLIRHQFFFVDQYFESAENKLQDMKHFND